MKPIYEFFLGIRDAMSQMTDYFINDVFTSGDVYRKNNCKVNLKIDLR